MGKEALVSKRIKKAARVLDDARRARRPIEALPDDCRPRDAKAGYAVQDALHARQAEHGMGELAGYKIGCTTRVMQEMLGIASPCAGGIFARNVFHGAAAFRLSEFVGAGAECEIAMRLSRDVPASGAPYTGERAGEYVESCMAAMEVVENRYSDFAALGVPTLIADDFFQRAVVVGEPVHAWHELDLAASVGTTTVDGVEAGRGRGADVMGNPLEALAWLANALAERGRALGRGDIVLTGALVAVQWLVGPADVVAAVSGLGRVNARFESE
jgi:2-oxo-3-hexenedioate decarboxylase/2-keto-4-pentenoate hydratase